MELFEKDFYRLQELAKELDNIRQRNNISVIELRSDYFRHDNPTTVEHHKLTMTFRKLKFRGEDFKNINLHDENGNIVHRDYQFFLNKHTF